MLIILYMKLLCIHFSYYKIKYDMLFIEIKENLNNYSITFGIVTYQFIILKLYLHFITLIYILLSFII